MSDDGIKLRQGPRLEGMRGLLAAAAALLAAGAITPKTEAKGVFDLDAGAAQRQEREFKRWEDIVGRYKLGLKRELAGKQNEELRAHLDKQIEKEKEGVQKVYEEFEPTLKEAGGKVFAYLELKNHVFQKMMTNEPPMEPSLYVEMLSPRDREKMLKGIPLSEMDISNILNENLNKGRDSVERMEKLLLRAAIKPEEIGADAGLRQRWRDIDETLGQFFSLPEWAREWAFGEYLPAAIQKSFEWEGLQEQMRKSQEKQAPPSAADNPIL